MSPVRPPWSGHPLWNLSPIRRTPTILSLGDRHTLSLHRDHYHKHPCRRSPLLSLLPRRRPPWPSVYRMPRGLRRRDNSPSDRRIPSSSFRRMRRSRYHKLSTNLILVHPHSGPNSRNSGIPIKPDWRHFPCTSDVYLCRRNQHAIL